MLDSERNYPRDVDGCQLCRREVSSLTRHHLIPKTLHGKKNIRRQYDRDYLNKAIVWVCRSCHSFIHGLKSESELAAHYNSLESLRALPEVQEFTQWLGSKPAGFSPKKKLRKKGG
ncbi:hypothetical protein EUZ85_27075 [Hahella sp. KA22]|uniref:hypothetical protein n=1 Tax=Hahella sp. KA22 TaxID=1628392 RepID=UPI000FDE238E|nr:hypothetical protein [Hahella sp. KA22]AZZ94184.1 hypothetical protein ENC22_24490 [Hahella sp. KA22]QAY57558.1 hypothetical protein EUZ85_27075 [Hahella sp. KA22]